jgi:predicted benzoate:H+ symporter BenE
MVGVLVGAAMTLKNSHERGQNYDFKVSFIASISCGFFGVVGGGLTTLFLPQPTSPIMMITGGIILSCITSLFTTEEIKLFFNNTIKRVTAIIFNLKLPPKS